MADFPATRASLLVRLRDAQDADAWAHFVDLYAPLVYGYARKQGLQDADAADLSQDVLRVVAGAVGKLDYNPNRGAFRNWLFTIVRRKLLNWRSAARVRAGVGEPGMNHSLAQMPAPNGTEFDWDAEWDARIFSWACEQVRRAVTDSTWQAFWKTAVDGHSGKEVAAELGLSVAAVYLARSRVQARLKELVASAQES
jgi:RNA polymerase sigma-70 factor (ECF subfamily)